MSIESDRIAQLEADLKAVWERKHELDAVEVALRARIRELEAGARALVHSQWPAGSVERMPLEDVLRALLENGAVLA